MGMHQGLQMESSHEVIPHTLFDFFFLLTWDLSLDIISDATCVTGEVNTSSYCTNSNCESSCERKGFLFSMRSPFSIHPFSKAEAEYMAQQALESKARAAKVLLFPSFLPV
jgi:hypothetical protein